MMSALSIAPYDWFAHACRMNEALELERQSHGLSRLWATTPRRLDALEDMLTIREAVRGVIRAHGIPRGCRIDLAQIGQQGAGCAGFEDAPTSFTRPFIYLDKTVYETCDSREVLDVYCGIGLHEAGHVLHTREFYRRMARGHSRQRKVYENLWEDERIEELVRQASPGFAAYLQAAKHALLEQGGPAEALARWDELPDMDRVNALIFAFIRIPHRIPPAIQQWAVITGECVFDTLRSLFPHNPRDEANVATFAALLEQLWRRLRRLYPSTHEQFASSGLDVDSLSAKAVERLARQLAADAEDRSLKTKAGAGGLKVAPATPPVVSDRRAQRLLDEAVRLSEAQGSTTIRRLFADAAEHVLKKADHNTGAKGAEKTRDDGRFGLADVERVLNGLSTIRRTLNADETKTLKRLEAEEVTFTDARGDAWDWGGTRKTEISYPRAEPDAQARYEAARLDVRQHVAAMRSAFASRLARRVHHERDAAHGRLDRRRLARATISDRIFRRTHVRPVPGLGICLLLDESGSMNYGNPSRAHVALRVAVLVIEALRGVPGIELEVYAHTSCGDDNQDCLVRPLYGKRNQNHRAVGSYCAGAMGNNYDHQAIRTVAKLFRESTTHQNRWLLVVSDGAPNGVNYSGKPAIQATKEAVQQIRLQGIKVFNVAIADYRSEAIFGTDHVVKFTDLHKLVENMRRLIFRIVRRVS
jgi:hypothetical protein